MPETEKISIPSKEECIETLFRDLKERPISMMQLNALQEAERRVKKHYERLRKLEVAVEALLECEWARRQTTMDESFDDLDIAPDRDLYMKAVKLAREAMGGDLS